MADIVIIGNTAGAFACMDRLKKSGNDLSLTVISEESYPAYKKSLLFDLFLGKITERDIFLCKDDFYQQNNIRFIKEARVASIDTNKKRVGIRNGERLRYDYLLFSCGLKTEFPDVPGVHKRGIFGFDTLTDLKQISDVSLVVKQAAVIGDSPLSFEFAHTLTSRNIDTKLFSRAEISEFIGEGEVKAIRLNSRKVVAASMVVFLDKRVPDMRLFEGTGIQFVNSCIQVDERMRTNIPAVFAIGSLISKEGQLKSWQDVYTEGETAADSILE